jgi:hypothetical protein
MKLERTERKYAVKWPSEYVSETTYVGTDFATVEAALFNGWLEEPRTITPVGKTFTEVVQKVDYLLLKNDSEAFLFVHEQDCCEHVEIADVTGDISDLVGHPLLTADLEESEATEVEESGTWSFYKFATIKGYVDIRWLGESNGYYSETVDMEHFDLTNEEEAKEFEKQMRYLNA